MNRMIRLTGSVIATMLLLTNQALAEVTVEAGTTIVGQQTSKQNNTINKNIISSADLVMDADIGLGSLHLYVEASTTPTVSASSVIAGSNLDAGTALNRNGKGRIQLSEIAYGFDFNAVSFSIGVQDLTSFADATAVSNDEGSQFLADSLVNNPSISFPDYTPSIVLNYGSENGLNVTALVANAYGLSDNPNVNYGDLFKFGRDRNSGLKKGIFALSELRLSGDFGFVLGGWVRTSELPQHLGAANKSAAFGVYTDTDGSLGEQTLWSVRFGWNSGKATDEVVAHASLAVEHAYRDDHLIALGVAWNGLSSEFKSTFSNAANPLVAELYYRWKINEYIAISPDVQCWSSANSLSTSAGGAVGGTAWVYGLRIQIGGSHQMSH